MRRTLLIAGAALVGLILTSLIVRSAMSQRPSRFSSEPTELPRCPALANCVSSTAPDAAHRIEPLPFTGTAAETLERASAAIESLPRTSIVTANDRYLHAEFTSLLFRFVDDLELLADPEAGVLQVRSASRTGRSDLGTNRRRVELLRARLAE